MVPYRCTRDSGVQTCTHWRRRGSERTAYVPAGRRTQSYAVLAQNTPGAREPIDTRRAARGQLARTGSFLLAAMSSCWRISLALLLSLVLLAPPCDAKVAKLDANTFAMAVNHPNANSIVMFHAPW